MQTRRHTAFSNSIAAMLLSVTETMCRSGSERATWMRTTLVACEARFSGSNSVTIGVIRQHADIGS